MSARNWKQPIISAWNSWRVYEYRSDGIRINDRTNVHTFHVGSHPGGRRHHGAAPHRKGILMRLIHSSLSVLSILITDLIIVFACNDLLVSGQTYNNLVEITPKFTVRSFTWGEYNRDLTQNLEENGVLYSAGITSKIKFGRRIDLYVKTGADYYSGLIDYDGFLQNPDGTTEPFKTKSKYGGMGTFLNVGYDMYAADHFIIGPECGVQYEHWIRDIGNGDVHGYDEVYDMVLIDFGCNFMYQFSRSANIFLNTMGEYPLLTSESINLASRGQGGPADINLTPLPNIGMNVELGATTYGVFLSFYVDYRLFSRSAFDKGFFQPRSDRTVVGMNLGYTISIN